MAILNGYLTCCNGRALAHTHTTRKHLRLPGGASGAMKMYYKMCAQKIQLLPYPTGMLDLCRLK